MIVGAATGYVKTLQLVGTGYRAEVKGKTLNLSLGFSHPVNFPIPEGIKVEIPGDSKGTIIILTGADKEKMGQTGREDPRLPSAGAVRRQGRSLPGREGPREGRQGGEGRKVVMGSRIVGRERRKLRIRRKISGTPERPRLTVFRSAKHIYAQVVDDVAGTTLAHASTLSKDVKRELDETQQDRRGQEGRRADRQAAVSPRA